MYTFTHTHMCYIIFACYPFVLIITIIIFTVIVFITIIIGNRTGTQLGLRTAVRERRAHESSRCS